MADSLMRKNLDMGRRELSQTKHKVLLLAEGDAHAAVCAALVAAGCEVEAADKTHATEPLARLKSLAAAYRATKRVPAHSSGRLRPKPRGTKGKPRRW